MPSACFSGLCLLGLAHIILPLCLSVGLCALQTHLLCSQWDIWRAPASAVLPEFWDDDEWNFHMSVWPRLLLEDPLDLLLCGHPGKDTTSQMYAFSFTP